MVSRVIGLGLAGLGLVLLRNSGPAEWWILGTADHNRRSHVLANLGNGLAYHTGRLCVCVCVCVCLCVSRCIVAKYLN